MTRQDSASQNDPKSSSKSTAPVKNAVSVSLQSKEGNRQHGGAQAQARPPPPPPPPPEKHIEPTPVTTTRARGSQHGQRSREVVPSPQVQAAHISRPIHRSSTPISNDNAIESPSLNEKHNDLGACNGNIDHTNGEWHTVASKYQRRKRKPLRVVVKGTNNKNSDLQTVERSRKIHICFLKPDTTEESMVTHMNTLNADQSYKVEKLTLKHNYYASFVLTVPNSKYDLFMTGHVWPEGVELSEWFRRGRARESRSSAGRGPSSAQCESLCISSATSNGTDPNITIVGRRTPPSSASATNFN